MSGADKNDLLHRARNGDSSALGNLIHEHQKLLERMAQKEVSGRLQARLSAADVVQQTCLSAIRNFSDFRGENEAQFAAWLKGVHDRNVKDVIRRHVHAEKRAVAQQNSLGELAPAMTDSTTASRRAMQNEAEAQLAEALETLPANQADAVRLRHLKQLSLREIAGQMEVTEVAVASLLKRGLASLRNRLPRDSE